MTRHVSLEPVIGERGEQPYVAVRGVVTMETFGEIADRLPGVFDWLAQRGIEPAGPPFFRYNLVDMERQLEVEAGVPVAAGMIGGSDGVFAGSLPSGRYISVTHVGHPDQLVDVTAELIRWVAERGLAWDMLQTDEGQVWGCRLEVLKTNPAEVPDPNDWETELVFRLADA